MKTIKSLSLKWSVSRAQDTYGYNVVKLIDNDTGEAFKTCGGGYDMVGTVLADWVEKNYQTELMQEAALAHTHYNEACTVEKFRKEAAGFYGMTANYKKDVGLSSVTLDGGCGISSIERILKGVLGLTLERIYSRDRKGRVKDTIGFYVYPNDAV